MTVDDITALLKDTEHNGYPVVVSKESQYLVGYVLRRELNLAIGKCKQFNIQRFFEITDRTHFQLSLQQMQNDSLMASPANRFFCSHQ